MIMRFIDVLVNQANGKISYDVKIEYGNDYCTTEELIDRYNLEKILNEIVKIEVM